MADRKQLNKWIPPDFDPKKHGSINKYRGAHMTMSLLLFFKKDFSLHPFHLL